MAVIGETNVTMSTIRDTLNSAGGSVGNDLTSFFKSSAKLNMWSKFKPMILNLNFVNLWDKRTTDMYYYQGADGNCGLNIPFYTDVGTFKSALTNANHPTAWSYPLPGGGENAPMRLGDFRRYNTNAINPLGAIPASVIATRVAGVGDSAQIDIEVNVPTGTSYNLGISDFTVNGFKFADMYPGVYLVKGSSGRFRTSTTKLGTNDSFSVKFPLNNGEGGDYVAYTFLSSVVQGDNEAAGTFVSVGGNAMNGAGQAINIKPAGTLYVLDAWAYAEAGTKNFTYGVEITNNSGAAQTFQNVNLQLVHDMDDGNGWQVEGKPITLATSVSVPTTGKLYEGTGTHSVVFNANDLISGRFGIFAYSDTPQVTGDIQVIEGDAPE